MNMSIRCIAATILLLLPVQAQESSVSFTGPRSFMVALQEIQRVTGTPISYEEPIYESASDLVRTTPSSHPGLRPILVARNAPNAVVVFLPGLGSTTSSTAIFVEAIVDAYNKAGLPGRYKVVRRQGAIDVVPSEVASFNGGMKAVAPIMSRSVTFPYAERSAFQTLQLIVDAIAIAADREVNLLTNPFSAGMPDRIASSASGLSVADELSLLATKAGIPAASYLLTFDPNENSFYLSVTGVAPTHPAGPGRREPGSTLESPFFIRTRP